MMRILILNWRDVRSPRGGGAERVTHDVARRLSDRGHEVFWLSSAAAGLPEEETIDGVFVVRRGSEATTRLHARAFARRVRPDVVLEEINTLPYLAPLWSSAPVVLYMNQLAREVWWYEASLPIALAGWLAEPLYLQAYRRCSAVTISRSSRDDLRRIGIGGQIWVAPMTVDVPQAPEPAPRARTGALIAVGRLTPSKRYEDAIRALAQLRETHTAAELTLVGDGRSRDDLRSLAAKLGLAEHVHVTGRVSEQEKIDLLDTADVLVGTSVREGWGLTVTEAAARGIPSVVYDIPGFRDSVVDGRTGLLVSPEPAALAAGVAHLLDDELAFDRLRRAAWADVAGRDREAAAGAFELALARAAAAQPAASDVE